MDGIPIADDLFRTNPSVCLFGARHRATGRISFPWLPGLEEAELIELPQTGTLWSYTVQRFEPKTPPYQADAPFEAFALGYIELADVLIVESRLVGVDFDRLQIGMPLKLTTFPLRRDERGRRVLMYAFEPASARQR